jgi:hypothetical protein
MKPFRILPLLLLLAACNDEVACTMEFRAVTIEVSGATLSDFYTIRSSTGDTLRHADHQGWGPEVYTVLDDSYLTSLINSSDTFVFKGFVGDSLVVNEAFVISADRCHINYVSGRQQVQL